MIPDISKSKATRKDLLAFANGALSRVSGRPEDILLAALAIFAKASEEPCCERHHLLFSDEDQSTTCACMYTVAVMLEKRRLSEH